MADFNIRSDSVNVEQIMDQIRARIREKRGVDYTEEQLRELAAVKLERILDPRGVRSDLLEQFKRVQSHPEPPVVPSYAFEDTTMFETHRGLLRLFRKLLNPILKLFFNPNALVHALHTQVDINRANLQREETRQKQHRDMEALYFEVVHNLVFEMTRTGIEVKNLKMRVESLGSRLEFNERRARSLESAVVYKSPGQDQDEDDAPDLEERRTVESGRTDVNAAAAGPAAGAGPESERSEGPGQRSRRRRRRRGRRGGGSATSVMGGSPLPSIDPARDAGSRADVSAEPGSQERTAPEPQAQQPQVERSSPSAPDQQPSSGPVGSLDPQ